MILFLNDWDKYPSAIADDQTKNTTWLRLAGIFKLMGVKNYYFHLALIHPELRGIDPYSPNLTLAEKLLIRIECEINPWYFFREIARLPLGNISVMFEANRANISLYWCVLNSIDYALLMIRQAGKSVSCDFLELYLIYIHYNKTTLQTLTKDTNLRTETINRIKRTLKVLPVYLFPITKTDADNSEVITCNTKENKMFFYQAQAQKLLAKNVGRGPTAPYNHFEELAFLINAYLSVPAMIGSSGTKRAEYEKMGFINANVYTTTPGKLTTDEGKYAFNIISSGMFWNEKLYDSVDKETAKNTVKMNSSKNRLLIHGSFNHRQIGKTDEWLMDIISRIETTPEDLAMDYFLKWGMGNVKSALNPKEIEIIMSAVNDPRYSELTNDNYLIKWYLNQSEIDTYFRNNKIILGLDTSDAIGADATALIMVDTKTLNLVAVCTLSEGNLTTFGKFISNLLIKYKNTTLIFEKKNNAPAIVDGIATALIAANEDPFKRIYNRVVEEWKDKDGNIRDDYRSISRSVSSRTADLYINYKGKFGFNTTGTSKKFLYQVLLLTAVKSSGHLIKDRKLADELSCLEVKNGVVDHPSGGNDDCVMAWLLCQWFIRFSLNLQHYGISPLECLTQVTEDGAMLTAEETEKRNNINRLNTEIDDVKNRLTICFSIIEEMKLKRILELKLDKLNELGDITQTFDGVISSINEKRRTTLSVKQSVMNQNTNRY